MPQNRTALNSSTTNDVEGDRRTRISKLMLDWQQNRLDIANSVTKKGEVICRVKTLENGKISRQ